MNSRLSTSGSGPIDTGKRWNVPGSMAPPDHVIFDTASVMSPLSPLIGFASVALSTLMVQPGTGSTLTNAIGWSVGKVTSSIVVRASSRSFGTWNTSVAKPPWVAFGGWIVTCADAGPAARTSRTVTVSERAETTTKHGTSPICEHPRSKR